MRTLLFALVLLLLPTFPASGQDTSTIQNAIKNQQNKAEDRQEAIGSLEQSKKRLKHELAAIEQEVQSLATKINQQEELLIEVEASEVEARNTYLELQAWRDTLLKELQGLLAALWPIHSQGLTHSLEGLDSWKDADRRFTWLAYIYRATQDRMVEAARTAQRMAESLEEQSRLTREAAEQLSAINANKDQLLQKRLKIRASIRAADTKRADLEGELKSILSVIKELNYKLTNQNSKRFADNKKILPWPCPGTVFSSFSPWAKPARRGIGMSTTEHAKVKSVFWGKVVHADILRGFGRVVIVYHGYDYYSVYAYLASSLVSAGQEVEKDEPLGIAGYHPDTKQPGLYFELRLGSKPINPLDWLYPK
ncbi:MAG: peptidoglycan DD-metalloendopeptidase family protein [Proteobacteria bacterium]|nr:peptidoglycan DD-metalloendopeptidase family protein [Pseudomonadota bacterium]MBU1612497.1 peptidoglycan DD-metalloendopeptidase family protein [Pseudomonadota bacterium]